MQHYYNMNTFKSEMLQQTIACHNVSGSRFIKARETDISQHGIIAWKRVQIVEKVACWRHYAENI